MKSETVAKIGAVMWFVGTMLLFTGLALAVWYSNNREDRGDDIAGYHGDMVVTLDVLRLLLHPHGFHAARPGVKSNVDNSPTLLTD